MLVFTPPLATRVLAVRELPPLTPTTKLGFGEEGAELIYTPRTTPLSPSAPCQLAKENVKAGEVLAR